MFRNRTAIVFSWDFHHWINNNKIHTKSNLNLFIVQCVIWFGYWPSGCKWEERRKLPSDERRKKKKQTQSEWRSMKIGKILTSEIKKAWPNAHPTSRDFELFFFRFIFSLLSSFPLSSAASVFAVSGYCHHHTLCLTWSFFKLKVSPSFFFSMREIYNWITTFFVRVCNFVIEILITIEDERAQKKVQKEEKSFKICFWVA